MALLAVTGGMSPTVLPGLPDAGSVTRWGLPAVTALRDASAAVTVGVLVLAAACVPGRLGSDGLSPTQELLRRAAVVGSVSWAASGSAVLLFAYSDAAGTVVGSARFWSEAWFFATQLEAGRPLLSGTMMAWTLALCCGALRRTSGLGFATLLALASLWPLALGGHSAGTLDHNVLVDLQLYHLLGVTVWTGGLVGLLFVRPRLGAALHTVAGRYSRIAGWCLVLVAGSGVAGALVRLPGLWAVESAYGALLAAKVVVLTVVGALGFWQRTRILRRIGEGGSGAFAMLVAVEVVLLLVGAGAGVALARTGIPGPTEDPSLDAAQVLLGRSLPPALGPGEWLTQWRPDLLWLPLATMVCVVYVGGVLKLRARGERWPAPRAVLWASGWFLVAWATAGAPGVYGPVIFSMHVVQHVTLAVIAPIMLVMAAPVTLALRAIEPRTDGSNGPREWIAEMLRSFVVVVASTPVVAAGVFIASFPLLYFTGVLRLSMESHTVHQLVAVQFLFVGLFFVGGLIGQDPHLHRTALHARLVLLVAALGLHGWFSATLLATDEVLAADWFGALQRPWGATLAEDQEIGALLGWVLGELPLVILAGFLVVQWISVRRHRRCRAEGRLAHPAPLSEVPSGAPQKPGDREASQQALLQRLEPDRRRDGIGQRHIRDEDRR
ncbi:cytochrome c oxidase assembly protein [Pimelobacter simplex]|uniref:cytochrome c oxidase assembly protein n=1 Tax=Nocardioides simplex TaxID=2045 RepID=UPI0037FA54D0